MLQSRFYYVHSMDAVTETERIKELAQGHRTEFEPRTIRLHGEGQVTCGLMKMVAPPLC